MLVSPLFPLTLNAPPKDAEDNLFLDVFSCGACNYSRHGNALRIPPKQVFLLPEIGGDDSEIPGVSWGIADASDTRPWSS